MSGGAPTGIALVLAWTGANDGRSRRVLARYQPTTGLQIVGQSGGQKSAEGPMRSAPLESFPQLPTADELVIQLRVAMETVERWMMITVQQA
jgi:predicted metal-dependent phosphotriesterase family hydrolase